MNIFREYIPQVYLNYKRKSTKGWNIFNILCDFTGGAFSFIQNIIDYERNEFSIEKEGQNNTLNIAKFAISFIAMFFDIIFRGMMEHKTCQTAVRRERRTDVTRFVNAKLHDYKTCKTIDYVFR